MEGKETTLTRLTFSLSAHLTAFDLATPVQSGHSHKILTISLSLANSLDKSEFMATLFTTYSAEQPQQQQPNKRPKSTIQKSKIE